MSLRWVGVGGGIGERTLLALGSRERTGMGMKLENQGTEAEGIF